MRIQQGINDNVHENVNDEDVNNKKERGNESVEWNLDDSRPIWPQLKEQLLREIIAGRYAMGGPFPTVRDLAEDAGVNRNTMQRAMADLEADGFLITNRTAGRVVTTDEKLIGEMKQKLAEQNIKKFIEEMAAIGYSAGDVIEMIVKEEKEKGVNNK